MTATSAPAFGVEPAPSAGPPGRPAVFDRIRSELGGRPGRGAAFRTTCPAHDDQRPSLDVDYKNGKLLVKCRAGCEQAAVIAALRQRGLWPEVERRTDQARQPHTTQFKYVDATGRVVAIHKRVDLPNGEKSMPWLKPDGSKSDGAIETPHLPLYRLPELLAAPADAPVYLVEGEKACDAARAAGLVAVSLAGGAGQTDFGTTLDPLAGRTVVLWPDNDESGRTLMQRVSAALRGKAAHVRVLGVPGLPAKGGDAFDYFAAGRTTGELGSLLAATPANEESALGTPAVGWAEPEDRGLAVLSDLGTVEYVEDLIRPGRIVVWAAEEGAGKSFALSGELGIRMAAAGGSFAGTWPILRTGGVLALSEMHADDDFEREAVVLSSLGLERSALRGRYFRLPLLTAAGGEPALISASWRTWITEWCSAHGVLMMIVDTATGATQVNPWGEEIHEVYRGLRAMLDTYPELAIVLVVHCKKPQGHAERRISDVLGEWGRWCDVVVLQERDGTARTKLSTFKRVRQMRRIVATQAGGLLIDPLDLTAGAGPKVPPEKVVAAVLAEPGLSTRRLADALGVTATTAAKYLEPLTKDGRLIIQPGPNRSKLVYPGVQCPSVSNTEGGHPVDTGERGECPVSSAYIEIGTGLDTAPAGVAPRRQGRI